MAGIFQRFINAVNREYERRIKRASLITEYGAAHHDAHEDDEDEGEVEIINVPRGAEVKRVEE